MRVCGTHGARPAPAPSPVPLPRTCRARCSAPPPPPSASPGPAAPYSRAPAGGGAPAGPRCPSPGGAEPSGAGVGPEAYGGEWGRTAAPALPPAPPRSSTAPPQCSRLLLPRLCQQPPVHPGGGGQGGAPCLPPPCCSPRLADGVTWSQPRVPLCQRPARCSGPRGGESWSPPHLEDQCTLGGLGSPPRGSCLPLALQEHLPAPARGFLKGASWQPGRVARGDPMGWRAPGTMLWLGRVCSQPRYP